MLPGVYWPRKHWNGAFSIYANAPMACDELTKTFDLPLEPGVANNLIDLQLGLCSGGLQPPVFSVEVLLMLDTSPSKTHYVVLWHGMEAELPQYNPAFAWNGVTILQSWPGIFVGPFVSVKWIFGNATGAEFDVTDITLFLAGRFAPNH